MTSTQDSVKPLIQLVLGYLAIRIRSKDELVQYLQGKTDNHDDIEAVLEYLESHGLIDDNEFAKAWAESRLRKNKGDLFIRQELRQKGVKEAIIQDVIQQISPSQWREAIETTLSKYKSKWAMLTGFPKKAKIFSILRQRGFSSRHIDAFISGRVE